MKISACSIVKNEALNIGRSIESYKDSVDEIIIVDTGSTDNTVEICKAYGAKVFLLEWNNNFAEAKNFAINQATGDWIIFLDADEWFVPKLDKKLLVNIINKVDKFADGIISTMCDCDGNIKNIFVRGKVVRIFKRSKKIRYHGSIHERIKNEDKEIELVYLPEFEIFHSGYSKDIVESKSKRNLDTLYKELYSGKKDTLIYYYLFRENYILKNLEEAITYYDMFIAQGDHMEILHNNTSVINIYEYMYRIMKQRPNEYNNADINSHLNEAYNNFPNIPVHSYLLGCEKMDSDYNESFKLISKAIDLNANYSERYYNLFVAYLSDAYNRLGFISQNLGNVEEALGYYLEALKIAEDCNVVNILSNIFSIVYEQPEEEIILFINSIVNINKREVVKSVLNALKKTRLHKVFIYYALKYNKNFDEQDETTYIAMILLGQIELVVKTAIEANKNFNSVNSVEKKNTENISTTNSDGYEINCEDWHLTYAVIAILYSKDYNIYERYKLNFKPEQRAIIDAYLNETVNNSLTKDICAEFDNLFNTAFYILNEPEIYKFKEKVIGEILN